METNPPKFPVEIKISQWLPNSELEENPLPKKTKREHTSPIISSSLDDSSSTTAGPFPFPLSTVAVCPAAVASFSLLRAAELDITNWFGILKQIGGDANLHYGRM
jgi:hypothetical protein